MNHHQTDHLDRSDPGPASADWHDEQLRIVADLDQVMAQAEENSAAVIDLRTLIAEGSTPERVIDARRRVLLARIDRTLKKTRCLIYRQRRVMRSAE